MMNMKEKSGSSGISIAPFSANISPSLLEDLKARLTNIRWPDELTGSAWDYGKELPTPPRSSIEKGSTFSIGPKCRQAVTLPPRSSPFYLPGISGVFLSDLTRSGSSLTGALSASDL
jgi:hypothetical protein